MASTAPETEKKPACGCKGIRSCLICENVPEHLGRKGSSNMESKLAKDIWFYCLPCRLAYKDLDHSKHTSSSVKKEVKGVFVQTGFLSPEEETELTEAIDMTLWVESQSGRRKQDFGPKINFKKRKVKTEAFTGFPAYSNSMMGKLKTLPCLENFYPVEMCNLEYLPCRGAAIDPHFDDFWIWGERLVTVNLLSDTVYSLTEADSDICIRVQVPRRCVIVLYGEARYKFMHSIARSDISERRIGITIRELTPIFLEGGEQYEIGKQLLERAKLIAKIEH